VDIIEFNLFQNMVDPVKTEETIYKQLCEKVECLYTDYTYVALPLAWIINTRGPNIAQQYIDTVVERYNNRKLFFVCQHIKVDMLNFYGHMVFTPHATYGRDDFKPIAHCSVHCVNTKPKPINQRRWLMSFCGSFRTSWTRTALANVLGDREDCLIQNTERWFFEKSQQEQKSMSEFYIDLLKDTKVNLCPRGTGPSTIRMWECMSAGCVPLIISDNLKLPLEDEINWNELLIRVPESNINNVVDYIPKEEVLLTMSNKVYDTYIKMFSNDKLINCILMELKCLSMI
jgi:hypothetical protein